MTKDVFKNILGNVGKILEEVDENQVKKFIGFMIHSRNIFLSGSGRSGLVAKAFAMRLMHLGFNVHVVGETTAPSVRPGDLVIAISGSGKTTFTLAVVKVAKDLGIDVISITSYEDSPLAQMSDCIVKLRGREGSPTNDYTSRQLTGEHEPLTPLGTLFEISCMVFLDSVIVDLMKIYNQEEQNMKGKHANLE